MIFGSNLLYQYFLPTPFDFGVLFKDHSIHLPILGSTTGIAFSTTGNSMSISSSDGNIYTFPLSTAFDITNSSVGTVTNTQLSQVTDISDLAFSTDGLKMFIASATEGTIYQYTLTEAFAPATNSNPVEYAIKENGITPYPTGLAFSSDGTDLFVLNSVGDAINFFTPDFVIPPIVPPIEKLDLSPAFTLDAKPASVPPIPSINLSSAASVPITGPITVTATFSEKVIGFTQSDITITGGTTSTPVRTVPVPSDSTPPHVGTEWTFLVTPTDTSVTVSIPTGIVVNDANALNTASTQLQFTTNAVKPTVTLSSDSGDTINTNPTITVVFSEAVTGFTLHDIKVSNGTPIHLVSSDGGTTWTFTAIATHDGPVTISIPADSVIDTDGSTNTASDPLSFTSDKTAPTVISRSTVNSVITIIFREAVIGFEEDDIIIHDAFVGESEQTTVSDLTSIDNGVTWTFTINQESDVKSIFTINSNTIYDNAGNGYRGCYPCS